jgi:hypothetical protein
VRVTGRLRGQALLLMLLAAGSAARAQQVPASPAAPAAPAPAAYQDRVLEATAGGAQDADDGAPTYDPSGWPRYLRLEGRLGTVPFDPQHKIRPGLVGQAQLATPNHGSLSVQGSWLPGEGGGSTFALSQRGLPLASGILAQHELGVIDRPQFGTSRSSGRVQLPGALLRGGSAVWEQPVSGWQALAASGQPGQLEGLPTSRFVALPGRRSAVGWLQRFGAAGSTASDDLGPGASGPWTLALDHERAQGVRAQPLALDNGQRADAQSSHASLRWVRGDWRVQADALQTQVSSATPLASAPLAGEGRRRGGWLNLEWDDGPLRHQGGLLRLGPGLSWAQLPMAGDAQAAYYRGSWRTRQWTLDGSLDLLQRLSRPEVRGVFATGNAWLRISRDHSAAWGFALRRFDGDGWNSHADWRWVNAWGATDSRLEVAGASGQGLTRRLGVDHDWQGVPQGFSLASGLSLGQSAASQLQGLPARSETAAALTGSAPLGLRTHVNGQLRLQRDDQGARATQLNLGLQWRVAPGWTLDTQWHLSQGRVSTPAPLDPLAPPTAAPLTTSDRSFFVVLRHEREAGSRATVLGAGRGQQGAGRIHGVVFYDLNRNGRQEAQEAGVPDVTVVLDNRFAVRTDAQGRFEFALVAVGPHRISPRSESLPLPWNPASDEPAVVQVELRGSSELRLPVQQAR